MLKVNIWSQVLPQVGSFSYHLQYIMYSSGSMVNYTSVTAHWSRLQFSGSAYTHRSSSKQDVVQEICSAMHWWLWKRPRCTQTDSRAKAAICYVVYSEIILLDVVPACVIAINNGNCATYNVSRSLKTFFFVNNSWWLNYVLGKT